LEYQLTLERLFPILSKLGQFILELGIQLQSNAVSNDDGVVEFGTTECFNAQSISSSRAQIYLGMVYGDIQTGKFSYNYFPSDLIFRLSDQFTLVGDYSRSISAG
jgi:hypothetical protein